MCPFSLTCKKMLRQYEKGPIKLYSSVIISIILDFILSCSGLGIEIFFINLESLGFTHFSFLGCVFFVVIKKM